MVERMDGRTNERMDGRTKGRKFLRNSAIRDSTEATHDNVPFLHQKIIAVINVTTMNLLITFLVNHQA